MLQSIRQTTPLSINELSDESLIQALADGAIWAIEPLYERYSPILYAMACRMVGDQNVAQELLQDTFVAVWQHAGSYSSQSATFRTWIISIMRHRAIDYLRGVHRRSILKKVNWEEVERDERTAIPDAWEEAWHSVQVTQVRECMMKLSPEQRMVIELAYFGGLTQAEIANRCHIPLGTVTDRIRLGLRRLKQELEKKGLFEL